MSDRRPTATALVHATAECLSCPWTTQTRNAQAIAARHHDATGHAVTVHLERTITYGDPHADHPTLFDAA